MNGLPSLMAALFVLFAIVAIVVVVYGIYQQRQRREAMKRLARRLGLEFHPEHVNAGGTGFFESLFTGHHNAGPYEGIDAFQSGHSRRASNTLHGHLDGREVWAGDWRYKTGSGGNESTHHFSYVLLALPMLAPRIWIREEGFFDSIAQSIGFNDLDFEHVGFSDAYHVKADDDRFAYDLFHPPMIELFLAGRPEHVRIGDGWLLVGDGSSRWDPATFERKIDFARRVLDAWPRHLLAGQGAWA